MLFRSPEFFFPDDIATNKLTNLNELHYGDKFTNIQLGIEEIGYYQVSSIYTYKHNDRNNWGSAEKDGDNFIIVSVGFTGQIFPAYNKNTFTINEKSSNRRDFNKMNRVPLMVMYVPHPNASLEECSKLFFSYSPYKNWGMNFECEELTSPPQPNIWNMHIPVIQVTGPVTCNSNDKIELTVRLIDPETNTVLQDNLERTVYIQPIFGYVNKTRCKINNSNGDTFTFRALDLEAGETARIKLGWRNITGLVDYNITII